MFPQHQFYENSLDTSIPSISVYRLVERSVCTYGGLTVSSQKFELWCWCQLSCAGTSTRERSALVDERYGNGSIQKIANPSLLHVYNCATQVPLCSLNNLYFPQFDWFDLAHSAAKALVIIVYDCTFDKAGSRANYASMKWILGTNQGKCPEQASTE